ncbi:phosphomannomutase/phosphoglucomutase [Candidatus Falkowbacteria bacterium]|nr:phosphomannomutase/phosphoglucomutase [Candidatus Falkowbacteria bacterium]NCT54833.1 phosphomannomutase/phosphoglucomutase [Candidatus Falkowbacteria bacterium]
MLEMNPVIFKAYDIRGVYGQDFDNELAYRLGKAYVALRKNDEDGKNIPKLKIGVAYDMRLSSPALKEGLIRGLTEAGADVVDLGLIATPTFYFAVGHFNYDGGIMISASHNPKEWNGFKLVRAKGLPISGESGIEFLKEQVLTNHFLPTEEKGSISENKNAQVEALSYALSFLRDKKIKPLKIVIDTANGMGGAYLGHLFRQLNININYINFPLNGNFPAHEADPLKEENLEQLKKEVKIIGADLGITTDGDGDRIFFVDDKGETIDPAIIRGLMAKLFLEDKPGAKIGYDVRPGKITADLIKENGGIPVITRVGHSLIKEQMIKEDIYFAGESSGHFYFNGRAGCFEYPEIIIIKLLLLLSESGSTVSEIIKPYKKYFHSGEINKSVSDKEAVFKRIQEKYQDGKINLLDGVSITYENFWFNVRGSNTEAKIRLNLEAINEDVMKEKRDEILALIY